MEHSARMNMPINESGAYEDSGIGWRDCGESPVEGATSSLDFRTRSSSRSQLAAKALFKRFSLSSYETGLARAGEGRRCRPASRSVKLVDELLCLTLPLVVLGPGVPGVLGVSADPVISAAAEKSTWRLPRLLQDLDFVIRLVLASFKDETL
jgi:hypothetical protein